jgi:hypothetical protein
MFGPTIMPQPELLHPEAGDVLEILIVVAHVLGLVVNLLLGRKCFIMSTMFVRTRLVRTICVRASVNRTMFV